MSSGTQAVCTPAPLNAVARSPARGFAEGIRGLWRAYWARRAQRASVMFLSSLDNRTLSDIGLDRSEIASFVYDKTKDRRRRYQPNWE